MCLDVMLLAVNILLLFFSTYIDDGIGFLFLLCILVVGASASAIGLVFVITYYRHHITDSLLELSSFYRLRCALSGLCVLLFRIFLTMFIVYIIWYTMSVFISFCIVIVVAAYKLNCHMMFSISSCVKVFYCHYALKCAYLLNKSVFLLFFVDFSKSISLLYFFFFLVFMLLSISNNVRECLFLYLYFFSLLLQCITILSICYTLVTYNVFFIIFMALFLFLLLS